MKPILSVVLMALALSTIFAQESRLKRGDSPPNEGAAVLYITPMPSQMHSSLRELCEASTLIIDGTVEATLPSRETSPRALETDAVILVNRSLKGAEGLRQAVISQRGGAKGDLVVTPAQYSLVRRGERYIFFLTNDERANIPDVDGVRRYLVTGIWSGLFHFQDGRMRVNARKPDVLRGRFEGLSMDQVITEITKVVK